MSGRNNKFSKAMGHLKSSKIDEKIGYLNKEMKKMGVISEQPANSTSDLYCTTEYIPPVPESPAEFTDVPDPNGVRDAGYVQPSNGYDSNDPNTWENAYPNTDWLYNPNDVAGETDRPVLLSPDTPPTGQTIGRFGPGGGLVRATIGYGMGLGYLKPDNTYQGLLYNSFWGDLYAPTESNRHGGDAPYRGYTDEEYALMQDAYSKMQGTTFGREIKFWDGWSYFWYGNWDSYGGTKKEVAGGAKFVLRTGYISGDPSDYMSKPHENEIPGKTIVLTQHSLDDPNFYPGNPNGFMDFLRNALGVGREALDWLTDAAGDLAFQPFDKALDVVNAALDFITDKSKSEIQSDINDFKQSNQFERLATAGRVYGDYLSGDLKDGSINNDYLGQEYVNRAFAEARLTYSC